ncbi:hypothetical protein BRCON_2136 [Candidatus Sumerlaea chitinivorans]|uniref:Uncharacterized protein n=1 Tax=Sumerlaea chitinivorans TaxID=2250252 RepID=A0A2Z4Y8Y8_SUMC1|nr:hypothetical protein BRCON_2136 [Candidatus Sumerlaea chitinivorans]
MFFASSREAVSSSNFIFSREGREAAKKEDKYNRIFERRLEQSAYV